MILQERIIELEKYSEKPISNNRMALFLDRDGVIIRDVGYISKPKDVSLEKGIQSLLKYMWKLNIPVFIVTNQSGISRGYYDWKDFDQVNQRMLSIIGEKSSIKAIFANSHLDSSKYNWRKPNPEMILCASKKYNINTIKSILIGDRLSDMIAGCRSGIKTIMHVKTGHGKEEYNSILKFCKQDIFTVNNMKSKIIFIDNLLQFPYEIFRT